MPSIQQFIFTLWIPSAERLKKPNDFNKLIDCALASLTDVKNSIYIAKIFNRKSNRARRKEIANVNNVEIHVVGSPPSVAPDVYNWYINTVGEMIQMNRRSKMLAMWPIYAHLRRSFKLGTRLHWSMHKVQVLWFAPACSPKNEALTIGLNWI